MDLTKSSPIDIHHGLIEAALYRVNTCIPGEIVSFDDATQTCSVKPAIKDRTRHGDFAYPQLDHVPLVFPFATVDGLAMTLPVKPGNPCLLIFSQRCIENWLQYGGIQSAENNAVGARHHDLNDGFAILCGGPLPEVLGSWCMDGIEIRNRARTVRLTVKTDGIEVDGPVTFKKDVTFQQKIVDKNGIDHATHLHGAVQPGVGVSGVPRA